MLILHDPTTLEHKTVELLGSRLIDALESPERLIAIIEAVRGSHDLQTINSDISIVREALRKTHDHAYLDHLETAYAEWRAAGALEADGTVLPECFPYLLGCSRPKDMFGRAGYYAFDMSSGIGRNTFPAALASAGLALQAAQSFLETGRSCFALCRPPGHHCDSSRAGGYCYVNNAVVATEFLLQTVARVTILDLDFHHGNGTQTYFYERADVRYISIHGQDEYPYYTGAEDEIGRGDGRGENFNLPLPAGASKLAYLAALDIALRNVVPNCPLVISLGFDTFELDPIGHFKLATDAYEDIGRQIGKSVGSAIILLEGGYVVERLGANVIAWLRGFEQAIDVRRTTACRPADVVQT
ncbi:hypothetical protein PYCC9005_000030 [Savitreella phatthalungensis]